MQVDVYERELDAVEAAADEAAARILAAGDGAAVALPGGRRGRALLAAIAAHGEIPWASTRWFVTDDVCGEGETADSARALLMSTVLAPNRAPASTLSVPNRDASPAEAADAWAADLRAVAGDGGGFAVVVLAVAPDGAIAGLEPRSPADGATVVGHGGRVSIGPDVLATAQAVVVVAIGSSVQAAVRDALTQAADPTERPLQRVLPDAGRVRWFVDRAAVASLVDEARVVEAE